MMNPFVHRWTPLLATLFLVSPSLAQQKEKKESWVGATVLTRKPVTEIKFSDVGADGKPFFFQMRWPSYRVVNEKDGQLQVHYAGQEGWVDKADMVLLRDAPAYYTTLLRQDPKNTWALGSRAIAWRNKGELDNAIKDYGEYIQLAPNEPFGYTGRGNVWRDKKEYDKAIIDFTESIRLDPSFVLAYSNRGNVWKDKKEYDKAITDLSEAIRLDAKHVNAYSNRGGAWAGKKEYDKAIADYSEAIRLDPKYMTAYNARAWIWATCPDAKFRDGKKAVDTAQFALELDPKNANTMDTLAAAYAESGDFGKAVEWQEKALADPRFANNAGYRSRLELYRDKKAFRQE